MGSIEFTGLSQTQKESVTHSSLLVVSRVVLKILNLFISSYSVEIKRRKPEDFFLIKVRLGEGKTFSSKRRVSVSEDGDKN